MQAKPRASLPFSPPGHRRLHHPPSDLQNAPGCNEASSIFRKQPTRQHQGVKPSSALSSATWWQAANAATLLSSACMQSGSETPEASTPKPFDSSPGILSLEYGDENTAVFPMWPKLHINEPGMSCFQKSHACFIQDVWGGGGGRRR